jgi:hypothetical protein
MMDTDVGAKDVRLQDFVARIINELFCDPMSREFQLPRFGS